MIPEDKFQHALVSTVSALVVSSVFIFMEYYCLIVGSMFTAGLSLGSEYGDKHATGNHWRMGNLLADLIGIVIGCGIAFLFLRIKYE